jgi:predicted secreted protein
MDTGEAKSGADLKMEETPDQPTRGCLKAVLTYAFMTAIICSVWYVLFGPKGILMGLAAYPVMRFADFFHDVFAPRKK